MVAKIVTETKPSELVLAAKAKLLRLEAQGAEVPGKESPVNGADERTSSFV